MLVSEAVLAPVTNVSLLDHVGQPNAPVHVMEMVVQKFVEMDMMRYVEDVTIRLSKLCENLKQFLRLVLIFPFIELGLVYL